jgi:ring-1,2-phenylacetyl-CoA epoxidase subunit PaaD
MTTGTAVADAIAAIPDPEVPVITIAELGILRDVEVDESSHSVTVTITPTYSGCPAMEAIAARIRHEAQTRGYAAEVATQLSPAWTTDWMSDSGKDKLARFGIAPPGPAAAAVAPGPVPVAIARHVVTCPFCGSTDTTEIAHFGSTACKALRRCETCREPFDEFKAL